MQAPYRLGTILLLGFASGLPLALSGSTLQAWYTVSGLSISAIGLLSLVGVPYVYKFLWAPLLDRYSLPLGRRKGWMLTSQIFLIVTLLVMSGLNPNEMPWGLAMLALALAFFSATQDVAVDAYRAEVLKPTERGLGAALSVSGYRIAMLVSGGVALIFAENFGWQWTFIFMAVCMSIGVIATLIGPNPTELTAPTTLTDAIYKPFKEFMSREKAMAILCLVVLYKIGDAYAGSLTTSFLIRGVGFSLTEIGTIYKVVGLGATLAGLFFGGWCLKVWGLYKALMFFGVLQVVSNLAFLALTLVGKHLGLMVSAVLIENIAGGMGTAAFVALLMSLCHMQYTATQFALLSALSAIGRVFIGPSAGLLVDVVGWSWFFCFTFVAGIPGLVVLGYLKDSLFADEKDEETTEAQPATT